MKKLQFKCTLLSDIILNQKAATEGNQSTLDFIPGNNFLGITAQIYSTLPKEKQIMLFHSGDVSFGDAHPGQNGIRSLRVPGAIFTPKIKKIVDNENYVHHFINSFQGLKEKQLKQARSGFYCFEKGEATEIEVLKTFALKSAYDRENRRSKDEAMYGYQSIDKDTEFYFEVALSPIAQEAGLEEVIKKALEGNKKVGRSRSAQYGLVHIEAQTYSQPTSTYKTFIVEDKNQHQTCVSIYADSRLIFLDEYYQPTFTPDVKILGIKGKILWDRSQIRTFQYAPWNYIRQARDTDRCGIEKGSVLVIAVSQEEAEKIEREQVEYLGSYRNEGFGKVLITPNFMAADKEGHSITKYKAHNKEKVSTANDYSDKLNKIDKITLDFLKSAKKYDEREQAIFKKANEFAAEFGHLYNDESFNSQWGTIRNLAMKCKDKDKLSKKIGLTKDPQDYENGYITHGVAKDKWAKKGRINKLISFYEELKEEEAQLVMINLASIMAKKKGCKR